MRRTVADRPWTVRLLTGLTIAAALAVTVPLGSASATQPDTGAAADSAAPAGVDPTEAASQPSPNQDTPARSDPDGSSATADPEPASPAEPDAAAVVMSWATRFWLRQYLKGSLRALPLLGGLLGKGPGAGRSARGWCGSLAVGLELFRVDRQA